MTKLNMDTLKGTSDSQATPSLIDSWQYASLSVAVVAGRLAAYQGMIPYRLHPRSPRGRSPIFLEAGYRNIETLHPTTRIHQGTGSADTRTFEARRLLQR